METEFEILEKPQLKDPILIEGLPGIGNVGRISAGYLIEKLGAKKFGELYSPHFLPFVLLHEDVVNLLKSEFYYWKNEEGDHDLIILVGDCQCGEPGGTGHYEVSEKILEFAEEFGVKKIVTLGGFGTGEIEEEEAPSVLGAVTDEELLEEYKDLDVEFKKAPEKVGMIVGATGLLLGLGKTKGMEGICLMGETAGFPIITDPKAAEQVLKVLMDLLDIEIDLERLDEKVGEMEEFLGKLENIQKKAMKQLKSKGKEQEKLRYIG